MNTKDLRKDDKFLQGSQPCDEKMDINSNEYIVCELAKFLREEVIEQCPISIISREIIDGENAELVRFTFGECENSCVAIVYTDGIIYTPSDWQTPVWDEEGWKISDTQSWMDCHFRHCIMLDGMPRMLSA